MLVGVMSDLHIPYHDTKAVMKAIDACSSYDVDAVVLLGDVIDFYSVSFWSKDPKKVDFQTEVAKTVEFLGLLRDRFSSARIIYVEGNHEERLFRYLCRNAPELAGLDVLEPKYVLKLDQYGIEYESNRKRLTEGLQPFSINNVYFLHGHEVRVSYHAVNIARAVFLKVITNCVVGHFHRSQGYVHRNLSNDVSFCYTCGCLCRFGAEFAPINHWDHGILIVDTASKNVTQILVS